MPPKPQKPAITRAVPRNLPSLDESPGELIPTSAHENVDDLISGRHLEDRILSDLDLSRQRIPSIAGSNLLLERVSFANCEIGSIRFTDVRLVACDLSNALIRALDCTRVEFIDCKLVGLNAPAAKLQDVLLNTCDARLAQLSRARIYRSEIRSTQLRESALNEVDFENTILISTVLRQADLASARLANLDLRTCDIEEIVLRPEDLRGAIVSAPQAMDLARFLGLIIR